jgi:hypothetical protein
MTDKLYTLTCVCGTVFQTAYPTLDKDLCPACWNARCNSSAGDHHAAATARREAMQGEDEARLAKEGGNAR